MIDRDDSSHTREVPPPPAAGGLRSIARRLLADELLRHTGILFAGMMVMHICNLVFQMAVSRALPKAEYALLAAFLATLAIIQRPLSTLATGVSHYTSLLNQEGRSGDVKRLVRKWVFLTGTPAVLLGLVIILLSVPLSGFMHMDRTAPIIIFGAVLPALFCTPVLSGAVQGLQRFTWGTLASINGSLVRLVLGAGFVWFLFPACGWAMLGHGLSIYASGAMLVLALFLVLRGRERTEQPLPSMRFYLLQSFFAQVAYAVLMTADVVLVKHFLPEDAEFAYAATLGRLVVFLPGAIVVAMFPKVASGGTTTAAQRAVFLRSLGYTALFVAAAVLGCWLLAGLFARIVFGIADASDYLKRMIALMALVMGFSALLNVALQFVVAQRRFRPAYVVIGCAVLYLAGALLFHASSWQIALCALVCNAGALFALVILLWRDKGFLSEAPA